MGINNDQESRRVVEWKTQIREDIIENLRQVYDPERSV